MRRVTALDLSFLMLLIALPLISFGTIHDTPGWWWVGTALLVLGFLTPLMLRFITLRVESGDEPDCGEEPS
jgi:hypothetical protein